MRDAAKPRPLNAAAPENAAAASGRPSGGVEDDALSPSDWSVRLCGGVVALFSVWLSMAWLGGTPGGIVDWTILGLIAAFGYTLGTLIPAIFAMLLALVGGKTTSL